MESALPAIGVRAVPSSLRMATVLGNRLSRRTSAKKAVKYCSGMGSKIDASVFFVARIM